MGFTKGHGPPGGLETTPTGAISRVHGILGNKKAPRRRLHQGGGG